MADLPEDRLTPGNPPFTTVGVDYFGPFKVRRSRSLVKRYSVPFTCLTVRAVHIEVAHSLDTASFLLALRRIIARRGQVPEMRSDNGRISNGVLTPLMAHTTVAFGNVVFVQCEESCAFFFKSNLSTMKASSLLYVKWKAY